MVSDLGQSMGIRTLLNNRWINFAMQSDVFRNLPFNSYFNFLYVAIYIKANLSEQARYIFKKALEYLQPWD